MSQSLDLNSLEEILKVQRFIKLLIFLRQTAGISQLRGDGGTWCVYKSSLSFVRALLSSLLCSCFLDDRTTKILVTFC